MIRATVLRALVLTAAFAAALTPVTCLGENSNRLPTKATKELPPELPVRPIGRLGFGLEGAAAA